MNRRHAAGLVSLLAGAVGLAGCSEPVRNDGRMFERWADAVAAIPIDDGSHAASPKPARPAQSPLKIDLGDRELHGVGSFADLRGRLDAAIESLR